MTPRCDGCDEMRQDITNLTRKVELQQTDVEKQRDAMERHKRECDRKFAAGNARFDDLNELLKNVNDLVTDLQTIVKPFVQRERDLQGVITVATKIKNLITWFAGVPIAIGGAWFLFVWFGKFLESMPK